MGFCYACGSRLEVVIPPGDDRQREVCPACGRIHYGNPLIMVGAFLHHRDRIFWIRRGTQPNRGRWTFPTGYLEQGETLQNAAARELFEETCIEKAAEEFVPLSLFSLPDINQVYVSFHCRCECEDTAQTTAEVAEWGWFSEADAPWSEMAYPELKAQVRKTYGWLREGHFPFRVGEISAGQMRVRNYYSDR